MASLHFHNLDVRDPERVMRDTFYGLGTFHKFLKQTRKYLDSDAAVLRLSWEILETTKPDKRDDASGYWVQLKEPDDRPNEPPSTFKAFLDDNVRKVFETPPNDESPSKPNGKAGNKFDKRLAIKVVKSNSDNNSLLLERMPEGEDLLLRPDTLTLHRQLQAISTLQGSPAQAHLPLLRLLENIERATWPTFQPKPPANDHWFVLTDDTRDGTDEQRHFVELALATPDFVFLEGPPGSGKTTAICELILQLAHEGKRVLLCASTHVAVDNVLERLMDERQTYRDMMIPVRIGDNLKVSEKAAPWQLDKFVKTERRRILDCLAKLPHRSASQEALFGAIQHGTGTIERMILDTANLVCGTTIGILQHPDIHPDKKDAQYTGTPFDVLIIDEASKTTFQEFLVPALYAKRWVIVGDPKQLSPFVDDSATAANIEACLPDPVKRNACIDVFMAQQHNPTKRRVAAVATTSQADRYAYIHQAAKHNVTIADISADTQHHDELWKASLVIGPQTELEQVEDQLPLDTATVRSTDGTLQAAHRRARAWLNLTQRDNIEQPEWSSELAWRMAREYDLRFAQDSDTQHSRASTREFLRKDINKLMPVEMPDLDPETVSTDINRVRRVAFPSVLESLIEGFERDPRARAGTALSDGLPDGVLSDRRVLLRTQHRMHPDIAAFSHEHIYNKEALISSSRMSDERQWGFKAGTPRAVWRDVRGGFEPRFNHNSREARAIVSELETFDAWAEKHPRSDGHPWEVAILTFYLGQEREVKKHLRKWTGQHNKAQYFTRGHNSTIHMTINLCTVDRFQGHEADVVIISFAHHRSTSFLESPNRLNVALTRARYRRVVIGDRRAMQKNEPGVLGKLAKNEPFDTDFSGDNS